MLDTELCPAVRSLEEEESPSLGTKEEIAKSEQFRGRRGERSMRDPGSRREREMERGTDTGRGPEKGAGPGPGPGVRDSGDFPDIMNTMINKVVMFYKFHQQLESNLMKNDEK